MFNDITKPPPPLPTTQLTELEPGLSILLPLSRRGDGPGLLVLVPDTDKPLAIVDGVPSQLIKWAEEGYTVVQIQKRALIAGAPEALAKAIQALERCDKCTPKEKIGLVGESHSTLVTVMSCLVFSSLNNPKLTIPSYGTTWPPL